MIAVSGEVFPVVNKYPGDFGGSFDRSPNTKHVNMKSIDCSTLIKENCSNYETLFVFGGYHGDFNSFDSWSYERDSLFEMNKDLLQVLSLNYKINDFLQRNITSI